VNTERLQRYPRQGPSSDNVLQRLLGMRAALGITRVADITGLDRIGIPVMQAVRPYSLSNAVSQGKGSTPEAAAISAIFECAESCFAERLNHYEIFRATPRSLGFKPEAFACHRWELQADDWLDKNLSWIRAHDLLTDSVTAMPLEMVHTAYVAQPTGDDDGFVQATTGLAAAFQKEDAVVHGILECVERDAVARAAATHGFFQKNRIDIASIDDPVVTALLERLRETGVIAALWSVPSSTGIPVIWCQLLEAEESGAAYLSYTADGSAAAFDPAAAVYHAVLEAAQCRLAAISGARDDITRAAYPKYPDYARWRSHRKFLQDQRQVIDLRRLAHVDCEAKNCQTALLEQLAGCRISSVLMADIDTAPGHDVSVVKVIIPELRPMLEG
jgi:YcaO-like protein with predicted kinase domain